MTNTSQPSYQIKNSTSEEQATECVHHALHAITSRVHMSGAMGKKQTESETPEGFRARQPPIKIDRNSAHRRIPNAIGVGEGGEDGVERGRRKGLGLCSCAQRFIIFLVRKAKIRDIHASTKRV